MSQQPIAINSMGHPIYPADSDVQSKAIALKRLKWPGDIKVIRRLSPEDFRVWIYGMDPRDALLITNEREYRQILERKKNRFFNFVDAMWRSIHGLC